MTGHAQLDDHAYVLYMELSPKCCPSGIMFKYEAACRLAKRVANIHPIPFSIEQLEQAIEILGTQSVIPLPWVLTVENYEIAESALERKIQEQVSMHEGSKAYVIACFGDLMKVHPDDLMPEFLMF